MSTKLNYTEYMRQWRSDPRGKTCDCGQPAATSSSSYWVCARCARLEDKQVQLGIRTAALREDRYLRPEQPEPAPVRWPRLVVRVTEVGRELIVRAHGEYHLPLEVAR